MLAYRRRSVVVLVGVVTAAVITLWNAVTLNRNEAFRSTPHRVRRRNNDTATEADDFIQEKTSSLGDKPLLEEYTPGGDELVKLFRSCQPRFAKGRLFTPGIYELDTLPRQNRTGLMAVHIFKNGGSTTNQLFSELGGRRYEHTKQSKNQLDSLIHDGQQWLRFALVRDPVTRAVSAYHEIKARTCKDHCFPRDASPEQIRAEMMDEIQSYLLGISQGRWSAATPAYYHLWLQVSFLYNGQRQPYPLDYIGRFEHYEAEIRHIMGDQDLLLPKTRNRTVTVAESSRTGKITANDLTEDVLLLICTIYRDDYCCFGYDFPSICQENNFDCN